MSVLVKDFDSKWKGEKKQYSRKLVEYCSSKALYEICKDMEQTIREGTFSRLSFDMMLAWEKPACADEQAQMVHKICLCVFLLFKLLVLSVICNREVQNRNL